MKLIDADELYVDARLGENEGPYISLRQISDAPTVDPVKHGHWIKDECGASGALGLFVICSECHRYSMGDFPYCPYCGAFMGEEATW